MYFYLGGSSIKPKGGKFNYSWFFEDAKPFDNDGRLQGFLEDAQDSEKSLTAAEVRTVVFEILLVVFEEELNKAFKKKGIVLFKREVLEVLTSCLEGVRKL
jgi:hypothetical protein